MTDMRSIAFVTGTGDLLNLYMYLDHCTFDSSEKQLYIVLLGNKKNITQRHLSACQDFAIQHFMNSGFVYIESDAKDYLLHVFNYFQLSITSAFEELFLFHVFGSIEFKIASILNAKKVILLENGIATYDPPKGRLRQSPQIDVNEAWLPLSPILGNPTYLNGDLVKAPSTIRYQKAVKPLSNENSLNNKFDIFIIGTSLYRLGIISLIDEIHAYSSYIEKLERDNTVNNILWKPHPRMQCSEINIFKDFEKVTIIEDDMPIELLFSRKNPSAAVSASIASSALLSGFLYFGIKPIILDAKITGLERFPHITRMQKFVSRLGA